MHKERAATYVLIPTSWTCIPTYVSEEPWARFPHWRAGRLKHASPPARGARVLKSLPRWRGGMLRKADDSPPLAIRWREGMRRVLAAR